MPMYRPASVPLWLSPDRIVIGGASGAGRLGAAAAAPALGATAASLDGVTAPPAPADAVTAPLGSADAATAGPAAAGARDGVLQDSARSKAPSPPQRLHPY